MTIQEFKAKYGYQGLGLIVAKFIERAPDFDGDEELAEEIGKAMADLESALKSVEGKYR